MRPRAIALYCLLTYALSWGVQAVAIALSGGDMENPAIVPFLAATMFTPTLAAILFLIFHPPSRKGLLWKPTLKLPAMLVAGVLVPTLCAFAVVAVVQAMGWGHSGWFTFSAEGVSISGGPWVLGKGAFDWPRFILNVVLTGGLFAGTNSVVAIGEEFGWRAFLQGHLIDRLGMTRGVILLGLIWSFWHLPSLLAGYNYPDHPVLGGLVLFPIDLVATSFFFAWLTLTARSFWPAMIAHAAGNSIQEGVVSNLDMARPQLFEDLTSLAVSVIVGLVSWGLLVRARGDASPAGGRV